MRRIELTAAATRQWAKLSPDVRLRLRAKLDAYVATGSGDVTAMKGRQGARLRVGDWRIVFDEDDDLLTIVAVGHRREVYE